MILKPNALVYLRRNDLFIGGKHISAIKMKFSPDCTNNLEVLNPDLFVGTCREFFTAHNMKSKRVLIVLDQSVVFAKSFALNEATKDEVAAVLESFVAAMPFEPGQRAVVQLKNENKLELYATNADLYQVLQESLRQSGMRRLIAITPAAAYKIDYRAKPGAVIEQFLDDKAVLRTFDFSTATPL